MINQIDIKIDYVKVNNLVIMCKLINILIFNHH